MSDENYLEVQLVDDETGEPIDGDNTFFISKDQFEFIQKLSEERGLSFNEGIHAVVREAIDALVRREKRPLYRFTVSESEGAKRAYSYVTDTPLPLGTWGDDMPDELIGEVESLGQSDLAPPFLWEAEGEIIYSVTLESP